MAEEDISALDTPPVSLKRTEEGLPFFQAEPEAPPGDPFEVAAERTRRSVQPQPRHDISQPITKGIEAFKEGVSKAPKEALKSWQETVDQRYTPPDAVYIGDDGQFYDKDQNLIPDQRKPTIAPVTRDQRTSELQPAMPGIFDIWNTLGSPAGKATLGAGPSFRAPGMGHNQGPPMGGGVPPPPHVAPPPLTPSGRQIIHGHDASEPFTFDDWYTQTIDNLHPLKILQQRIAEHGALNPGEEFYELGRLTRGSYGRTRQALQNSTFDYETLQNTGPGLKQVLEPIKGELKEFEKFAVAMRDVELLNRGIDTGTTLGEAQNIIASAPPQFRAALNQLHGYQSRILEYLKDSGVISDDAMNAMQAANRNYVPFHRMMDAPEPGTTTRNLKSWDPIKAIKGSDRDILSPIETIIRNTHKFIDLAEKNRVLNSLVDSADARGLSGLVSPAKRKTHPIHVTREEVEKFFTDNGLPVPASLPAAPDSFAIFRPNAFRPAPDEIAVWKDGKRKIYNVDPEVAAAVNGMTREELGKVMEWAALPARALRAGVVLTPEFMVKNLMRDQLMAATQSQHGYIPFLDYVKGLGHMMGNTQTYQMWLKSGGANVAMTNLERKYLDEQIKNMFQSGWMDALKNNIKSPLQALEKLQEYSEHPTRIGEFANVLRKMGDPHRAGFVSREITTDFARRGSSEGLMNALSTIPFARATIQGLDRVVREFHRAPAATSFKVAALVSVPTIAFYAANRQDPRIFDIPREERRLFWHIMQDDWRPVSPEEYNKLPERYRKEENGQYFMNVGSPIRVPKPFELGFYFGSTLEMAMDKFFSDHPEEFKKLTGKDFPVQAAPFKGWLKGAASSTLPGLVSQGILVPIEAISNYSFFRERPLVPKHIQSPENRKYEYTPFTTQTAKYLGEIMSNVLFPDWHIASPIVIENYVRGMSGTMGTYTLQGMDWVIRQGEKVAGKQHPPSPEMELPDYPVIRAFVTRLPSTVSTPITDFYQNLENSTTTRNLINRIAKDPAFGSTQQKQDERKNILEERSVLNMARTAKAMRVQMKQIEMIMASKTMTPPDKTKLIQIATLAMMKMASHANMMYEIDKKRRQEGKQPPQ